MIKLLYLNTRTYESYSMWWNGGSLINMMAYDRTIVEIHEDEILRHAGHDFEARQSLVTYRKHRAYLAWTLITLYSLKWDVGDSQNKVRGDLKLNMSP